MAEHIKSTDAAVQQRAAQHVREYKATTKSLCRKRWTQLKDLYREVISYEAPRQADWSSAMKMNFANQIESKVTARLTANSPKFIVNGKPGLKDIVDEKYPLEEPGAEATEEEILTYNKKLKERDKFEKEVAQYPQQIQTWLNRTFQDREIKPKVRRAAKSLVRYGNVYGATEYRIKHKRKWVKDEKGRKKIEKVKAKEYVDLNIVSFSNILLDPRYIYTDDSPGVIMLDEFQRKSELEALNDNLINLDKIKLMPREATSETKREMYQIKMNFVDGSDEKKFKSLKVDKFFGFFSPTGKVEDEGIWEIWVVADMLVIKMEEITHIPVRSAGCFEDVEQHFSVGYIEPIIGAQREYNFKINAAVQNINQALNRTWLWDPNSGIDPKALRNLGPGGILPVNGGVAAADQGLREIQYTPLKSEYFANQNEIRRDMQTLSFTVDTNAPTSQQGFTNTATAVRVRFFENNEVYKDTLSHFEDFLVQLGMDMLEAVADNFEDDVIIQQMGEDKTMWAKPEIFKDAYLRYNIGIELGSSSFDSVENRREENLALWTLAKDAKANQVNVKLDDVFEGILETFEQVDPERVMSKDFSALLGQLGQLGAGSVSPTTQAEAAQIKGAATPSLQNPGELTQAVAQGDLTA